RMRWPRRSMRSAREGTWGWFLTRGAGACLVITMDMERTASMVRNLARSSVLICGALLALPAAVLAAQQASSEFEVRAGVGNSDNVGRTFVDNESDTIATAGARFSLSKETRLLQANIDGDLSYVDYLKGTFD